MFVTVRSSSLGFLPRFLSQRGLLAPKTGNDRKALAGREEQANQSLGGRNGAFQDHISDRRILNRTLAARPYLSPDLSPRWISVWAWSCPHIRSRPPVRRFRRPLPPGGDCHRHLFRRVRGVIWAARLAYFQRRAVRLLAPDQRGSAGRPAGPAAPHQSGEAGTASSTWGLGPHRRCKRQ